MTCPNCGSEIRMGISKEDHVYYIGDDALYFRAYIDQGVCMTCMAVYQGENGTEKRCKALQDALDDYWATKFNRMGVNPEYVRCWRETARKLFDSKDMKKKRRVAEEFGLWMAGQHFNI